MRITAQNLGIALGQYLEQELAPQSSGIQKVVLYMAIPVLASKVPQMVEQYKAALELIDGVTDDGQINLDTVYPALKDAVSRAGKVPIMGIIFDESDVDKINARAMTLAQQ